MILIFNRRGRAETQTATGFEKIPSRPVWRVTFATCILNLPKCTNIYVCSIGGSVSCLPRQKCGHPLSCSLRWHKFGTAVPPLGDPVPRNRVPPCPFQTPISPFSNPYKANTPRHLTRPEIPRYVIFSKHYFLSSPAYIQRCNFTPRVFVHL